MRASGSSVCAASFGGFFSAARTAATFVEGTPGTTRAPGDLHCGFTCVGRCAVATTTPATSPATATALPATITRTRVDGVICGTVASRRADGFGEPRGLTRV